MQLFKEKNKDFIKGALIGSILGDALGVPYEFKSKEEIGNPNLKTIGKWSDDSSMILCTVESLSNLEYYSSKDIADKYIEWLYKAHWTPQGVVLDCGRTTSQALRLYRQKGYLGGLNDENSCGNGSLMRIMPLVLYFHKYKNTDKFNTIKEFSSITHSHIICVIGCAIYTEYALNLLAGMDKKTAYDKMQDSIIENYKEYSDILSLYERILYNNIYEYNESTFKSTGYIIHSLECALYSFITTKNYKTSIIKAISFGDDTDTVACITGGLSGLYYGYNKIPLKYINKLDRKEDILKLINEFEIKFK